MYKLIISFMFVGAVLVSAESSEEVSDNSVTTESNTKFDDILTDIESFDNLTLVTEPTKYGYQSNDTSASTPSNEVETVKGSESTTIPPTTKLPKFNRLEAEAEISGWSEKLDCNTSPLGEFKCMMLKKLIKKFFENVDGIESKKLTARIKVLVKKLEDSDTPMDPDMRNLIKKYKRYL